jgi:hypothetical protein
MIWPMSLHSIRVDNIMCDLLDTGYEAAISRQWNGGPSAESFVLC